MRFALLFATILCALPVYSKDLRSVYEQQVDLESRALSSAQQKCDFYRKRIEFIGTRSYPQNFYGYAFDKGKYYYYSQGMSVKPCEIIPLPPLNQYSECHFYDKNGYIQTKPDARKIHTCDVGRQYAIEGDSFVVYVEDYITTYRRVVGNRVDVE